MLQIARLAPSQLREATSLVSDFLKSQLNGDGGFKNRDGQSDLYYSVFGVESLLALGEEVPAQRVVPYLRSFSGGDGLDLVHLACLARCDAALGGKALSASHRRLLADRLAAFRSPDGGYRNEAESEWGTVYGCFLALGAHQDLAADLPCPEDIREFVRSTETPDGGYGNDRNMGRGSTPATAAAVTLLRNLGFPSRPEAGDWLAARCHREGGFFAAPEAPLPDLLSTATAIHALAGLEHPFEHLKEPCLDFVDSLWTNRGAFYGHWMDDHLDCEYTYYGLLALGHLNSGLAVFQPPGRGRSAT